MAHDKLLHVALLIALVTLPASLSSAASPDSAKQIMAYDNLSFWQAVHTGGF